MIDRSRRAALAALVAWVLVPDALAQDPRAASAQDAARQWLAISDRFDTEASYEGAGTRFRQALTPAAWVAAMKTVREPLGAVTQRTILSTQFTTSLPGQPDSEYVLIAFRTSWANRTVGRELVTLEVEGYRWRVAGYVIQ